MIQMSLVIKELHAAGVTGDALVAAIQRIETGNVSAGALRMRRHRASPQTATCDEQVTEKVPSPSPSPSLPPIPPNTTPPSIPSSKTHTQRGAIELPDDFLPDSHSIRVCAENNINFDEALSDMRDWAKSKRPRYHDWQATFRNLVKRKAEKQNAKRTNQKPSWTSEADRVSAKYAAEAMAERGQSDHGAGSGQAMCFAAPVREGNG